MKENIGKCYKFETNCIEEYSKIIGVTNGYYDVKIYSMGGLSIFKAKRMEYFLDKFWEGTHFEEISNDVYEDIAHIFNNVKIGKYDFA